MSCTTLTRAAAASPTAASLRTDALRDVAAVAPGIVPFGVTLGVTALTTHTGGPAAVLGATVIFGGSAQLAAITMLHLGSGLLAAILSGAVVNARLVLYGAALEDRFRGHPLWFRLLAPALLQDQTYLSAAARPPYAPADFRRYWWWLGLTLLAVWTGSVALGVVVGPLLPPLPHLALVAVALFVTMLVGRLVDTTAVVAAAAAAIGAWAALLVRPELGILAGAVSGVLAAVLWSSRARAGAR